jgi:hypothetical protein
MFLKVKLSQPISGYWDGGAKSIFLFKIDSPPRTDAKGQYVKVGSYEANHWFHVALGKTEKQTLAYAKTHIRAMFARRLPKECYPVSYTYVETNEG